MKTEIRHEPDVRPLRSSKTTATVGAGRKSGGVARSSGGKSGRARGSTRKSAPIIVSADDPVKTAIITRVMRVMQNSLQSATTASLQLALEAPTDAGTAAYLLSMMVNSDEAVRMLDPLVASILRGAAMKRDMLRRAGGVLGTADVTEMLGVSRQAVAKRVQRGTLLALTDASGNLQFPVLQFTDTGTVDGLETVLAAFNVESPWTRLAVLLDTDDSLRGMRVIDALRAGKFDAVMNVVRSFGA